MQTETSLKMIGELSDAKGVSGFEDQVVAVIRKYASGYGAVREDSLRNLYIERAGNTGGRPRVQLDAHTDEVGFMVQAICPNGTLRFLPMGGWVPSNIPAHKVWVQAADGSYIPGIVASKPPHYMSEAEKTKQPAITDMRIDIGASSLEEARDVYHVRIAAPVVPAVDFFYDPHHDTMIGKAFDCRLGCAAMIHTLEALQGRQLAVDVTAAFASQEEVGLRGASVTAAQVKPDLAIVFEGCPADDTVEEGYMVQTAIHKGPMLRHIDMRMITNPRFQRYALDLAKKESIPVQEGVRSGGSTNGASIHLSNRGVPTIVIGVPVRYIHTHFGIAAHQDVLNASKLACAILGRVNGEVIGGF
ncbi:MAG: M28 family peptidase [Lachnospiraceae bacterium]|jgi:putative aminopeptidase FrvX|nr:M28 family peptidase [Lachnospiraceae bacterium]